MPLCKVPATTKIVPRQLTLGGFGQKALDCVYAVVCHRLAALPFQHVCISYPAWVQCMHLPAVLWFASAACSEFVGLLTYKLHNLRISAGFRPMFRLCPRASFVV